METIYFNTIFQKATDSEILMMAVIPTASIGNNLPALFEMQSFIMPKTIYTGTYPQIKINTDSLKSREDLHGMGIAGIVTSPVWFIKRNQQEDVYGISLK